MWLVGVVRRGFSPTPLVLAAKKRANTSGVGKSNNYYEDIYIPPYNNTH